MGWKVKTNVKCDETLEAATAHTEQARSVPLLISVDSWFNDWDSFFEHWRCKVTNICDKTTTRTNLELTPHGTRQEI